ncbi:MAG: hypothetical protein ACYCVB_09125, partial [Bacilli bacterium]
QSGLWYVALIAGMLMGLFVRGALRAFVLAWLISLGGWGFELLWQSLYAPIGRAASAVAGMMGLPVSQGGAVIALTLILAFLFGTVGAWFGVALRRLLSTVFPLT